MHRLSLLLPFALAGCIVGEGYFGNDEGNDRIVNPTDPDDRVHVQVGAVRSPPGLLCSGTVIAPRVVLTAAHCFPNGGATSFTSDSFTTPAEATIVHPGYAGGGVVEEDDLALVLLRDPAPFAVAPIDRGAAVVERRVLAVGYGLTGASNNDSGTRRSGTVRVTNVGNLNPNLPINDMILTVADPSNICSGDSGGGIFDGPRLVGVTSGVQSVDGVGCTGRGFFTRIDRHYDFIANQVSAWGQVLGNPPPSCGLVDFNTTITPGELRSSCNGRYLLAHQHDGNVVVYRTDHGLTPLWASNTAGHDSDGLVMQSDGNLVLYGPAGALFHTGTHGHPGAVLFVQDDGNLVIYAPGNLPIWASNTAGQ
jgi:hypothetical protein